MELTGSGVRVVLFNYHKAFVLLDCCILASKTLLLSMPLFAKKWVGHRYFNERLVESEVVKKPPLGMG